MMISLQRWAQLCLLASLLSTAAAFSSSLSCSARRSASHKTTVLFGEGTGGWGLGNSREMVPEEFATKRGGERKAFEGYELTDRGDFMRKVRQDAADMRSSDMDELLGVAKIAGINVKDPSERLNKFDEDLLSDEEDLDLSV